MIEELDTVVLERDIDEHGLKCGDVGAIVHKYADGATFEVEFVEADGRTIAVVTLSSSDVRLARKGEILHVRSIA